MKVLKIGTDNRKVSSEQQVLEFEKRMGVVFPKELRELIIKYEGGYLDESQKFFKADEVLYEVNQMLYLEKAEGKASIEAIIEGHRFYGIEGYVPFATDSGGWDYNVSINSVSYGQVWVNKFDSDEENTMVFLCNTLEEFIDSLKSLEEVEG